MSHIPSPAPRAPLESSTAHRPQRLRALLLAAACLTAVGVLAHPLPQAYAQVPGMTIDRHKPVAFKADRISYDQKTNIVTLTGHVEAWQAGHVLFADRVLFDRNTNIADAVGHVVLVSPDGNVVYAAYAELSQNMTNGIMSSINVRMPKNAKLAANGARRTDGKINEMSRAVYTACDVCAAHPDRAPLWEISANSATQDLQHHMIEYHDATMEIAGVPVMWLPYFAHPDPTAKRMSGLLTPNAGVNSHIGGFTSIPYYWVIDRSSDAIVTPTFSSKEGIQGDVKYRKSLNFGQINLDGSSGYDHGKLAGAIFANGTFDLTPTWRAGFDVQRASSVDYLSDYSILPNANDLHSNIYLEGFGAGSYARIETSFYQGLVASVSNSELPVVLPYALYSYQGLPDDWGGTTSVDANIFDIMRSTGTNTQRAALTTNYGLPYQDPLGEQWRVDFHLNAAGYNARDLNEFPNYDTAHSSASEVRALPQVALTYDWPIMNDAGALGSQLFKPIVQLIAAPIINNNINVSNIPNEDSSDFQFTDANLFGFNKYPGVDRLENGMRANVGLQSTWYLANGQTLDGLIGQSYHAHADKSFAPGSGLTDNVSDIVARLSYVPASWLSFTYRTRLDHKSLQNRYSDAFVTAGVPALRVTAGYLYSATDPYYYYDGSTPPADYYIPRKEVTLGLNANYANWSFSGGMQQNVQTGQLDNSNVGIGWQNDCLGLALSYSHSNTQIGTENGSTTVLFTVTFKTIGAIGFNAL